MYFARAAVTAVGFPRASTAPLEPWYDYIDCIDSDSQELWPPGSHRVTALIVLSVVPAAHAARWEPWVSVLTLMVIFSKGVKNPLRTLG